MLVISSNCLDANIPKMYDVIAEVLNETNWNDLSHLKSVIASSSTELMNSLAQSGHGYAMRASSSLQSLSQHYSEIYSGIAQVKFMGHLHSNIDSILSETSDRLREISLLLKNSALKFSVNTEAAMQNSHRYQISRFSGCLDICPTITEKSKSKFEPISKSIQKFFSVPFSFSGPPGPVSFPSCPSHFFHGASFSVIRPCLFPVPCMSVYSAPVWCRF